MLRTKNIRASIDFYTGALGFNCDSFSEELGWASLSKDGIELMLATPNEHMPFEKPGFTGSLYFNVDDVDSLWKQLENRVSVCYPLEEFDYGMKEFAILDNNGYMLQFGESTR